MHKKNFGAVGAMAPTPLSLKTRGGGGGAGGCHKQGPGPAALPWLVHRCCAGRSVYNLRLLLPTPLQVPPPSPQAPISPSEINFPAVEH